MFKDIYNIFCISIHFNCITLIFRIICICITGTAEPVGGCGVPLALTTEGVQGGVIFHDKAKNIRDKMRYSNLSNNMMISEL